MPSLRDALVEGCSARWGGEWSGRGVERRVLLHWLVPGARLELATKGL
jgi:hypothetical protein